MYPSMSWSLQSDLKSSKLYAKLETKSMMYKTLMASETLPLVMSYWAFKEIDNMSTNSSMTRIRNRCQMTDSPRGILVQFGLSRLEFRSSAALGLMPGMIKR